MIEKITNFVQVLIPSLSGTKLIITTVILALVLTVISVSFEKYLDYRLNQTTIQISELVDTLVKDVVTETIESEKQEYGDRINKALQMYPEIDVLIDELLCLLNVQLGANQSVLFIYHDGIRTPEGFPFIRYTATNESINEKKFNVSKKLTSYQSVPYSNIALYAKKMTEDGIYYVNNIKQLELTDESYYYSLKEENVKSVAFIPIKRTYSKKQSGYIAVYGYDNYINFEKHIESINLIINLIEKNLELKYRK